ncbi:MAG: enoyl-CoA hydratase-related protein [Acidobacteriota bacterium]|nr:enoyl-CoA hydratase-related protein [Acidobacteriota bacterium]
MTIQIDQCDSFPLVALRQSSINAAMLDELLIAFAELQSDDSVRVIILTGNGEFFSIGLELKGLSPERAKNWPKKSVATPLWQSGTPLKPSILAARLPSTTGFGLNRCCSDCALRQKTFWKEQKLFGKTAVAVQRRVKLRCRPLAALKFRQLRQPELCLTTSRWLTILTHD